MMSILTSFLILFTIFCSILITSTEDISEEFSPCVRNCVHALVAKSEDASQLCGQDMCKCSFKSPGEDPCFPKVRQTRSLRQRLKRSRTTSKELPQLQITKEPPNALKAQIGSSATLTCIAESSATQNIGYSWVFTNSSKMIQGIDSSVRIENNLLILLKISKNNTGWFQCDASDGSNHALSRRTRVLPVYFDDVFIEEPNHTTVSDGTLQVTLKCDPPSSYPTPSVHWYKDGSLVTDDNALQTPSGNLFIHHVTKKNSGQYTCKATVKGLEVNGTRTSTAALLTVTDPSITPDNYLPSSVWNDNQMFLERGDTVTITCGVYGNPSPDILWMKGTKHQITGQLQKFPRIKISDDQYQLTIKNLQLSDTASYMCISKNLLDTVGLPISTNIYVVSNLTLSIPLVDKSLVKGDTFVLICKVSGNPPVTIDWYADGQKIVKQRNHVDWKDEVEDSVSGEYSVKSTLSITKATVDDTGLYQCIATNDHQNIVDTASIFISSVLSFEAAHFITPTTMYIEDTKSGVIRCGAQGSPMPELTWISLPSQYPTSDPVEGTSGLSSTKHIEFPIGPLSTKDNNDLEFTCLTSNRHAGQDYQAIQIITVFVGYPVEFISATSVVEVDKGSSEVLQCTFSGLPTPLITWERNGVRLPIIKSDGTFNHVIQPGGSLLIEKASNSDDTMFTCIGTNGFNSDSSEIQLIVISTGLSVVEGSGIGIGLLIMLFLILLIIMLLYKRSKNQKVDPEVANGVVTVHANAKALEKLKKEEEEARLAEQLRLEEEERKVAEEERLKQEEEERNRRIEERIIQDEAEAKRLDEERFAQEAARLEEEERKRLEEEAEKAKLLEEEKLRLEEEEKLKLEEEERNRLEEEEKTARLKAEEKAKIDAEEKAKLEAEEKAKLEAEENAKLEAEQKARLEAEEAKRKAEEEEQEQIRLESEEKARKEAEEKARIEAEEKQRLEALDKAQREAEEKARLEEEERLRLLELTELNRLEEERLEREKIRLEEEKQEKERLEEEARLQKLEMEKMQKLEEERLELERERIKLEEDEKARKEAEEKSRLEAMEKARIEAEEKARLEADEAAKIEAERIATEKRTAEENARLEAEEKMRLEAEEKLRLEAEEKAKREEEERLRLIELAELRRIEEEKREKERLEEDARLQKIEDERLRKIEEEQKRIQLEEEAKLKAEEEKARLKAAEEERQRQEERIMMLQMKEEEEMKKRLEEARLAQELFEDDEEAERKAAEKEAAREEALRKLEEDTALANAQQENATRKQIDTHQKNQSLAEKEYTAAVAAEQEADKAVKESKSDKEREIANRIRDGALNRTTRAGLNKDLADATISRDSKKLKPAIKKAEKKKVGGTENYLLQAKKLYEQLQTATQLKGATFDRRIADIEAAIHAIKKGGFETLLAVELLEAQVLLKKLKRIQKAALEVQSLSQQTIAIMKSYNRPPDVVVQVMRAVFLLLGHSSSELSTWPDIVIQLNKTGKDNTKRRIQCRVPEDIDYAAAKRVELILCKYDEELVFDTTQALGVFYNWAECIADERLALPEVLTEKHKSSGLFGQGPAPPPLPIGKGSLTAVNAAAKMKKKKTKPEENKAGKKKAAAKPPRGDLKIGAKDSPIPPPPKFLYNNNGT